MKKMILILLFAVANPAWAAYVCLDAAGFPVEYQDPGRPGMCEEGNPGLNLEEKQVSAAEYAKTYRVKVKAADEQKNKDSEAEIPLDALIGGGAGALAVFAGKGFVLKARKKKEES